MGCINGSNNSATNAFDTNAPTIQRKRPPTTLTPTGNGEKPSFDSFSSQSSLTSSLDAGGTSDPSALLYQILSILKSILSATGSSQGSSGGKSFDRAGSGDGVESPGTKKSGQTWQGTKTRTPDDDESAEDVDNESEEEGSWDSSDSEEGGRCGSKRGSGRSGQTNGSEQLDDSEKPGGSRRPGRSEHSDNESESGEVIPGQKPGSQRLVTGGGASGPTAKPSGSSTPSKSGNADLDRWDSQVEAAAKSTGLPANYIKATIWAESRGNPNDPSKNPEMDAIDEGVMQISDMTYSDVMSNQPNAPRGLKAGNPADNIMMGAWELKDKFEKSGGDYMKTSTAYVGEGINPPYAGWVQTYWQELDAGKPLSDF